MTFRRWDDQQLQLKVCGASMRVSSLECFSVFLRNVCISHRNDDKSGLSDSIRTMSIPSFFFSSSSLFWAFSCCCFRYHSGGREGRKSPEPSWSTTASSLGFSRSWPEAPDGEIKKGQTGDMSEYHGQHWDLLGIRHLAREWNGKLRDQRHHLYPVKMYTLQEYSVSQCRVKSTFWGFPSCEPRFCTELSVRSLRT